MFAAAIDRTDGMKYKSRGQAARPRHHGASGGTTATLAADAIEILHDGWTAGTMNGAIHATATGKRGIRGIHNRIGGHTRDVAHHEFQQPVMGKLSLHGENSTGRKNDFPPAAANVHFVLDTFDGRPRIVPVHARAGRL